MVPSQWRARGYDTVAAVLGAHARRRPDAPFLIFEQAPGDLVRLSYAEADQRATRTAGALSRHGVNPGDRFCVHLTNCPQFYDLWFAAAKLGATVVPTNPLSTAEELRYLVAHARCRVAVTQTDLRPTVEQSGVATVLDVDEPWIRADDWSEPVDAAPTDVLGVLYTSGTTSRPKGVMVSHAAYLHAGDVVAGHLRLRPDDRQLIVLPLFHGNAQYYSTMSALVTGASVALTPRFTASRWSEQASVLGATVASLFAAPIRMILAQAASPHDAAHRLRVVLFAQNVTDEQLATFERRYAVPLVQLYGMTETVTPPTINPLYEERRGSSIGRPVLGSRLRVVDGGGGDVAPGSPGELLVGGEVGLTLMSGYLDNPEATAEAIDAGWLHTGDTVACDADGYLYFIDRRKDLIKRAGENVSSTEVERVLNEHPAVFESAVIGLPDEMRDESVHAFVVLRREVENGEPSVKSVSEADLIEHCRRRLAVFKVPDTVELVDALPQTSVGKIQKHLLRPPPRQESIG